MAECALPIWGEHTIKYRQHKSGLKDGRVISNNIGVVYNENKRGPRPEPWGTPYMSLENLDRVERTFIVWNLSVKCEKNHLSAV